MNITDEQVRAALGAFRKAIEDGNSLWGVDAMRAALESFVASLGAEPHGYFYTDDPEVYAYAGGGFSLGPERPKNAANVLPVYTHPATARAGVDELIKAVKLMKLVQVPHADGGAPINVILTSDIDAIQAALALIDQQGGSRG